MERPDTVQVIFQPSGRRDRVPRGITLLEAAQRIGVEIESPCGGQQVCGKCRMRIQTGAFDKEGIVSGPEALSPWNEAEGEHITPAERAAGDRLACAATVEGDLMVFVPEASRAGKQVVSKDARDLEIALAPAVRRYTLTLKKPTLDDPAADYERLCAELESISGLTAPAIDIPALRALPVVLRNSGWSLSVWVWQDREIIRIAPGDHPRPGYGLAVDLGTTTIAGYLCDLESGALVATASMMNPQVTHGEDVISRISYHMNNPEGLARLGAALVEGLNDLIGQAVEAAGTQSGVELSPADIVDMCLCGNTAMQHFLLQLDPMPLGVVPFSPTCHHSVDIKARDLGIRIDPGAYLYVFPNQAGFVGGDNVAVILAESPQTADAVQLIIDIGTNGELVLGNREGLVSTSCATGPALEGAQIRFGMRAAPGAIERVRIDPESREVDYKVVGRSAWRADSQPEEMRTRGICGSGIIDAVAELYRSGIVAGTGAFAAEQTSPRFRRNPESGMGEFVLAWARETAIGQDVVITQKDIRQIQLAKGALYCACRLLMRKKGVTALDGVKIAGAFGSHVDHGLAQALGLFPDCDPAGVASVGNAAGDGCRMALLNREKRREADRIARAVHYMELSSEPDFQQAFMEATQIPHMRDAFPLSRGRADR